MEVVVYKSDGSKSSKKVNLNDEIYKIEPNNHAIYLDVKLYLANQRQGTHKAKERGEIAGSTRKIKKQKGTGTARAGSIKNPLFKGGGRIFGPRPKEYGFKLNKKTKRLARKSALSAKVLSDELIVLEDLSFDTPKTKTYLNMLKSFGVERKKTLLVLPNTNDNIYKSARNIQGARTVAAQNLSTHDVLRAGKIFLMEGSIEEIDKILA